MGEFNMKWIKVRIKEDSSRTVWEPEGKMDKYAGTSIWIEKKALGKYQNGTRTEILGWFFTDEDLEIVMESDRLFHQETREEVLFIGDSLMRDCMPVQFKSGATSNFSFKDIESFSHLTIEDIFI